MARLPQITERTGLRHEQAAVFDSIASGARGSVRGPHTILLHRPELADPMDGLGTYVRYDCAIPERQRELLILVVAAHWRADYVWPAHAPLAARAGIAETVIAAVGHGETPAFDALDDALVHRATAEVLATRRMSDETYGPAEARFGGPGVLDLIGLIGYYSAIAMVLNVFEVGPGQTQSYPWSDQVVP